MALISWGAIGSNRADRRGCAKGHSVGCPGGDLVLGRDPLFVNRTGTEQRLTLAGP